MIYFLIRINKWSNDFLFINYYYLLQYTNHKHLYKRTITYLKSELVIFLVFCVFLLCVPLRFPHKNDVRFVFSSSCFRRGACLIYVIFVCLSVVVSNTYCVVFLFCLSSFLLRLVYPMLPVSLDCPFFIAPSVFSNVYLSKQNSQTQLMPSMSEGLFIYIA
jgi:hypothetical protein